MNSVYILTSSLPRVALQKYDQVLASQFPQSLDFDGTRIDANSMPKDLRAQWEKVRHPNEAIKMVTKPIFKRSFLKLGMLYFAFAIIYLTFYFIFETIWAHSFLYITLVVVTYYMVMALYTVSSTWFLVTNKNLVIIMPTLSASFFSLCWKGSPSSVAIGPNNLDFQNARFGLFSRFYSG